MKLTNTILIVASLCLAASCQKGGSEYSADQASSIWLSARVVPASVVTRAPYTQPAPTTASPLEVAVWASATEFSYPDLNKDGSAGNTPVAKHTSARFQNSETPQLLSEAVYPQDAGVGNPQPPVYFVGLYPASGWSTTDGSDAIHSVDGKTDLMYAPEISGYYGIPYEDSPTFHFYHLFTWLRIEILSDGTNPLERESVANAWGNITDLRLVDQSVSISLDLTSNPDLSSDDPAVRTASVAGMASFTGLSMMPLYATGSEDIYPAAASSPIPTAETMTEVAYVLCPSVDATAAGATAEYTLRLTTAHRPPVDIPIDLKTASDAFFEGSTAGKQFTISLTFKIGNTITVSTNVSEWATGGYGTAHITE